MTLFETAMPIAGLAATLAVVWYTRVNAKISQRMENRQAPRAIIANSRRLPDDRQELSIVVVNCAIHDIALTGVELQGAPRGLLRKRPVLDCEVTWPSEHVPKRRHGLTFIHDKAIRAIEHQVEMTVAAPRFPAGARLRISTSNGDAMLYAPPQLAEPA